MRFFLHWLWSFLQRPLMPPRPTRGRQTPLSPACGHTTCSIGVFGTHLDLSKEQRDRIRDVWGRYQADTHDLKYDLMGRRLEMRKLFTDPKADQAALVAKEKELSGLSQKLMERRTQAMLEWRSVLTPEQIRKLDRMPHRQGMGRGFGMM